MKHCLFFKLGIFVLIYTFTLSPTYSIDDESIHGWEKDIYSFQKSIEKDRNHDREQLNSALNYLMNIRQILCEKPMQSSNSSASRARSLVLKTLNHEEISSTLDHAIDHAFLLNLIDDKKQGEGKKLVRLFSSNKKKKSKKEKLSNTSYKDFCVFVKALHDRFDPGRDMPDTSDVDMDGDGALF